MKALIVSYSLYGNTQKVAEAIAQALQPTCETHLLAADQITAQAFQGIDLLIFGAPTHRLGLPKELKLRLKSLPKHSLKGTRIAAFDTARDVNPFINHFTAAGPLQHLLRRLGGRPVAPAQSFYVLGREGPLADGELDRAREWAKQILARGEG